MKFAKSGIIITALLFFVSASVTLHAQSKRVYSKKQAIALKKLRLAVERNPDNLAANKKFIDAWGWGELDSTIIIQYNHWLKKFPKSSTIPFAIGRELSRYGNNPRAAKFLIRALTINPRLAEAWFLLSANAEIKGDSLKKREYLEKAIKLDPKNPEYAFFYAFQFRRIDTSLYRRLSLDMLKRFPKSELGTSSISLLIEDEKDEKQKIAYYELLKDGYAKRRGFFYYQAMEEYFEHVLITDPDKSLQIAQLQGLKPNIEIAKIIIEVKKLLAEQKNEAADTLLKHVQLMNGAMLENLSLFKAKVVNAAQHTQAALDTLIYHYSIKPTDTLQQAIQYYGSKLGLTDSQIEDKIIKLQYSTAKEAVGFNLVNYLTNEKVKLSDYKGKVILLTYWEPGLYNCREKLQFFEQALRQFSKNDIAYIGINLEPMQDDYVLPFIKRTGYGFIPLRDSLYHRQSNIEPDNPDALNSFSNYLIDQQGCIIYSGFNINEHNERTLELMISELIKNNNVTKAESLVDSAKTKISIEQPSLCQDIIK